MRIYSNPQHQIAERGTEVNMKITFLGTGAADWCFDEHSHLEGFRRNSAILIDDSLLVDPGPDVPDAMTAFSKDPMAVKYIINTHRHPDHYNARTVEYLKNAKAYDFEPDETILVGKYSITALSANHATADKCLHFIISDGERHVFYGLDGAWLTYSEVDAIKRCGIDLAVLDGTIGDIPGDHRIFEHNNLNMVNEIRLTLKPYIKRFFITHMARTLHTSQGELEKRMAGCGIEVAYDGLETEIE